MWIPRGAANDPGIRGHAHDPEGARVVFLFSGENIPVFLLTVFAKNEKANLSAGERAVLLDAAKDMIETYRR